MVADLGYIYNNNEKGRGVVSRVMCRRLAPVSVIYLSRTLPPGMSNLPPGNGRAALRCRYIWSCSSQDVRPPPSPTEAVGSYPAFSPLLRGREAPGAVVLFHIFRNVAAAFPFESVMLCAARTFLFMLPA